MVCNLFMCLSLQICNSAEHRFHFHSQAGCLYMGNSSKSAGQIFMKFHMGEFCKKILNHFNFHLDHTILGAILCEDLHTFLHIS
jgi:hypothetical protein